MRSSVPGHQMNWFQQEFFDTLLKTSRHVAQAETTPRTSSQKSSSIFSLNAVIQRRERHGQESSLSAASVAGRSEAHERDAEVSPPAFFEERDRRWDGIRKKMLLANIDVLVFMGNDAFWDMGLANLRYVTQIGPKGGAHAVFFIDHDPIVFHSRPHMNRPTNYAPVHAGMDPGHPPEWRGRRRRRRDQGGRPHQGHGRPRVLWQRNHHDADFFPWRRADYEKELAGFNFSMPTG